MAHLQSPAAVVRPDNAHMTAVALSSDGRTLYTNGDYYLRVFDVGTGKLRTRRTGPQLGLEPLPYHDQAWTPQVVLSPDGKTLAVCAETEIALLDPVTLKTRARLEATARITSIAFSADSKRLAIADGGVAVWDLVGKRPIHVFPSPDSDAPRPTQVFRAQAWGGQMAALSPDGNTVYAASQEGGLLAWDLTGTRGFVAARPGPALTNDALAVRVSADGRKVAYLANILVRVDVRDVGTGRIVEGQYPDGVGVQGGYLTWRPDGRAVLGVSGYSTIEVRDPRTGALVQRRDFNDGVTAAEYTPDGRLVIGTDRGHVQVTDASSLLMRVDPVASVIDGPVQSLALDPAEHAVAVEGTTQRVLVDYLTGRRLRSLPHLTFFAPDGSTSAVVDDTGAVGFQTDQGTRWIAPPDPSHAYGDRLSAYSHDSTWFASSHNHQVGLWNARTGTFVGSLPVSGQVAVGFTSDDSTLVVAGIDGSVETWNLRPEAWIRAACEIAGRDLTAQEWSTVLPQRSQEHVCRGAGS
ncbi:WD40 repeat domain-containing protein [Nostocoides sp. HKS02]|uniref:WD40 repeat domain-containing protein n=1 Tax=Nostocoides sp. HKS02 TaxID=1813880 RepID=UPI001E2D83E6|nr:WD40 repeat domain-containing protein [Tetrasphaera sp. HKS02]